MRGRVDGRDGEDGSEEGGSGDASFYQVLSF